MVLLPFNTYLCLLPVQALMFQGGDAESSSRSGCDEELESKQDLHFNFSGLDVKEKLHDSPQQTKSIGLLNSEDTVKNMDEEKSSIHMKIEGTGDDYKETTFQTSQQQLIERVVDRLCRFSGTMTLSNPQNEGGNAINDAGSATAACEPASDSVVASVKIAEWNDDEKLNLHPDIQQSEKNLILKDDAAESLLVEDTQQTQTENVGSLETLNDPIKTTDIMYQSQVVKQLVFDNCLSDGMNMNQLAQPFTNHPTSDSVLKACQHQSPGMETEKHLKNVSDEDQGTSSELDTKDSSKEVAKTSERVFLSAGVNVNDNNLTDIQDIVGVLDASGIENCDSDEVAAAVGLLSLPFKTVVSPPESLESGDEADDGEQGHATQMSSSNNEGRRSSSRACKGQRYREFMMEGGLTRGRKGRRGMFK